MDSKKLQKIETGKKNEREIYKKIDEETGGGYLRVLSENDATAGRLAMMPHKYTLIKVGLLNALYFIRVTRHFEYAVYRVTSLARL